MGIFSRRLWYASLVGIFIGCLREAPLILAFLLFGTDLRMLTTNSHQNVWRDACQFFCKLVDGQPLMLNVVDGGIPFFSSKQN